MCSVVLYCLKVYNTSTKYKSSKNVVYSCKYHIMFCPKYRRPVLVNGVDERLKVIKMSNSNKFNDFLAEQLKDEELKEEYDALDTEFDKLQAAIDTTNN